MKALKEMMRDAIQFSENAAAMLTVAFAATLFAAGGAVPPLFPRLLLLAEVKFWWHESEEKINCVANFIVRPEEAFVFVLKATRLLLMGPLTHACVA